VKLLFLLFCGSAAFAQQLALSLVQPPGQIRPGTTMSITVALSGSGGKNLAAWEGVIKSSIGGTWKAVDGPAAAAAAKTVACNAAASADFKCLQAGINQNIYADGVILTYSLDIPANAAPGAVAVTVSGLLGASLAGDAIALTGNSINFTLAQPSSRCDLNGDSAINAQDVQLAINQVLGLGQCSADLDGDGACRAPDLQRVIAAALGGACRAQ
jgi:hypothetical protein